MMTSRNSCERMAYTWPLHDRAGLRSLGLFAAGGLGAKLVTEANCLVNQDVRVRRLCTNQKVECVKVSSYRL